MAQMDETDLVYKAHESGEIRPGPGGLFGRTIELNPAENPFDWILKPTFRTFSSSRNNFRIHAPTTSEL